eukprot:498586-Hanusia_phi.AAC.2
MASRCHAALVLSRPRSSFSRLACACYPSSRPRTALFPALSSPAVVGGSVRASHNTSFAQSGLSSPQWARGTRAGYQGLRAVLQGERARAHARVRGHGGSLRSL